jgi:hypothetical protein
MSSCGSRAVTAVSTASGGSIGRMEGASFEPEDEKNTVTPENQQEPRWLGGAAVRRLAALGGQAPRSAPKLPPHGNTPSSKAAGPAGFNPAVHRRQEARSARARKIAGSSVAQRPGRTGARRQRKGQTEADVQAPQVRVSRSMSVYRMSAVPASTPTTMPGQHRERRALGRTASVRSCAERSGRYCA